MDVTAAIDVSDGLSLDLDRLLASSRVGAELDIDEIPIHEDAERFSQQSGRSSFRHAWSDGEDFELIVTLSEEDAALVQRRTDLSAPLTRIGTVVGRTGLWKKGMGKVERLSPQGYQH
ncbi:MAG: AIR synthase-related protein [Planctomycetota bacterium]